MTAAIAARDIQIMELQHRTRELLAADTASDLGRDKAELLDQINQQLTALAASRKVLEGLISKSRERTLVKVTNVRMSEGGRVVAGLVNTQGKYSDAHLVIDTVEATSGGKCIAGIAEGVNLDSFF